MTLFQKIDDATMDTVLHCDGCGCDERLDTAYFIDLVTAKAEYEGYDMSDKKEAAIAEELAIKEEMQNIGHAYCGEWDEGADADEYYDRMRDMRDE